MERIQTEYESDSRAEAYVNPLVDGDHTDLTTELVPTASGFRRHLRKKAPQSEPGKPTLEGVTIDVTELWDSELMLQIAAEASFDMITIYRPQRNEQGEIVDFVYAFLNSNAERAFGMDRKDVLGRGMVEMLKSDGVRRFRDRFIEAIKTQEPFHMEFIPETTTHRGRWIDMQAIVSGEIIAVTARDIHDKKMDELRLRKSEQRMNQAERLGRVGSFQYDSNTGAAVWSEALGEMLGVSASEVPASKELIFAMIHPNDIERLKSAARRAMTTEDPLDIEFRMIPRGGKVIQVRCIAHQTHREGELPAWIGTVQNISQQLADREQLENQMRILHETQVQLELQQKDLERANERLSELASRDGLTGLKNHRSFRDRLEAEVKLAERYGHRFTLILIDVDNFKSYNDSFGHPAGDELLRVVADAISGVVRQTDFVARYGGEEFAIILPQTEEQGGFDLADRMRRALETVSGNEVPVTASFGVGTYCATEKGSTSLLGRTDRALYKAKAEGRNCVVVAGQPT